MRPWFLAGIAACALQPAHAQAYPQSFCAPLERATEMLAEQGEHLIAWYRDGEIVKGLFGDRQSGAWTLVSVDSRGYVCTMRNGSGLAAPEGEPA
jgi:hypothetical protein